MQHETHHRVKVVLAAAVKREEREADRGTVDGNPCNNKTYDIIRKKSWDEESIERRVAVAMTDAQTNEGQKPGGWGTNAFKLLMSGDRMTLYIDCAISRETLEALTSEVCAELGRMGVGADAYLSRAAERLAEAVDQGPQLEDFVLLEGKHPTPPREGEMVWSDAYFEKGFEVNPKTGVMDYRRPRGRRSVGKDEHLATLHPPMSGEDGRDLMGKAIATGKPRPFRVRAGSNVRFDEVDGKFYSRKDGRIRFVGNVLSVDDVYTVNGSVGLKTGHIKHPGALVVTQNVEAEAEVQVLGDIEVHGYVENAEITTKGRLMVHGGITGGPKCRIRAEGGVHARYIQLADIESNGDIVVEHEIDQSNIKTRGAIIVTHGRIVGGEISALGGIETDQIGSEAFLRTNLTVGEDYTIRQLMDARKSQLDMHRDNLNRISERLAPLKSRGPSLPPKLRELAIGLVEEATKINGAIKQLEEELETIRAESQSQMKKEIIVHKRILPDVFFHIPPLTLLLQNQMDGPVRVKIHDGKLCLIRMYEN